jgi:acetylornithine deacetylase/succinyl-diaminopimelate desuccinylase-like protein
MRVRERLEQLYAIGGGPGANRLHPSEEEDEAHALAAAWMRDAGLAVEVDPDRNLLGRSGERDDLWVGSHLDTVPEGGRFDGALGVVAGIEAVRDAGHGSVVAFRGEEVGWVGSRALVARGGPLPSAYLELHIEQGPVLEQAGLPLGIVTSILGYARGELVYHGRADHSGTTPMEARDDALVKSVEGILRVREAARSIDAVVATVGDVTVEPGVGNVVPGRVRLLVEARAPDDDRLDAVIAGIGLQPGYRTGPIPMTEELRALFRRELEERALPVLELPSGAGHDAGILAAAGVSSAMLFVRSLNGGVSHSPDEHSSDDDVALGVEVLTGVLRRLAPA